MSTGSKAVEKKLADANRRLKQAIAALAHQHTGTGWEAVHAARSDVLRLERQLAESRSEPYSVPCDFPVKWNVGAPLPFLLCTDNQTVLTFYVDEPDPNWDGTTVNVVDPASSTPVSLCVVTFGNCASAKLGHPNDEAQSGHALAKRGLEGCTAQIVRNSPWIVEVAKTNSVHPYDDPERWRSLNHYIFWFHDSTFECLAESYDVEVTTETMGSLLDRLHTKLLD